MKVICAYCKTIMQDGPPVPVSHGICTTCFERVVKELDDE